ncbi:MAG: T9SS type A sorting domain-containing protein, partial [Candidatus Edwardsbacteria bacterium]
VHTWDLSATYDAKNIEWGMFHHDIYHTGNYHFVPGQLTSYSSLATAYNNGRKLVRVPNTDDLWVTYESANHIFATFSADGGKNWRLPVLVGEGKFPAISLAPDNKPHLIWLKGSDQLLYSKYDGTTWSTPYLLYKAPFHPVPMTIPPAPSFVVDGNYRGHITWKIQPLGPNGKTARICYAGFDTKSPSLLQPEVVSMVYYGVELDYEAFSCLALGPSPSYEPYIVWNDNGQILHRSKKTGVWSSVETIHTGISPRLGYPFVSIYGNNISALWTEEDASGLSEIYRSTKLLEDATWSSPTDVSGTPGNSTYPVSANSAYAVWCDNTLGNWEVYLINHQLIDVENVSKTTASSLYPHISLRPTFRRDYIYFIWAERDRTPYEVKSKVVALPTIPTPYFVIKASGVEPSPYCVQKDTYFVFGSEPYQSVDAGSTTLVYHLWGLNPEMRYRLEVVSYHESSGEYRQMLDIDGTEHKLIKFQSGIPETTVCWFPAATYKDGEVFLTITRKKGDWSMVAGINLYQFEREEVEEVGEQAKGATQTSEGLNTSLPKVYALGQSYPNPFNQSSVIKYQLPVESDVSLKIYNVCGQLVKTLIQEKQRPGYYSVQWNGKSSEGRSVASGVYFYRLTAGDFSATKKMILVR